MIADTTLLIDLMIGDEKAVAQVERYEREPLFITSLSLFELHVGIARSDTPQKEREKVGRTLEGQQIIPLDAPAARHAGELHGRLLKEGTPIGALDAMIAGIVATRDETLLTRNTKHFEKSGIKVVGY